MDSAIQNLSYTALIKVFNDVAFAYKRAREGRSQELANWWNDVFVALDRELNRRLASGSDAEEGC